MPIEIKNLNYGPIQFIKHVQSFLKNIASKTVEIHPF